MHSDDRLAQPDVRISLILIFAVTYTFIRSIHNTKREDVTFLAFQVWVLGMSLVALLNESIPHTLAALLTHLLATTWSVYQIFNTRSFQVRV
jgi:hypothetical protein